MHQESAILVINAGSSSVKVAAFALDQAQRRLWSGAVERIGMADSRFHVCDGTGATLIDERRRVEDHDRAFAAITDFLNGRAQAAELRAIGHRVVHGGADCDCPMVVTVALERRLRELISLAPLHLPANLAGIAAARKIRPDLLQVACFDTAFHHKMPRLAQMMALPRLLEKEGVRRYGFHGLSYEYILDELRDREGDRVLDERIVVAHLGNGSSMAAIRGGHSIETTMGLSALGGLPMGTRSGDLDPGVVLYLLTEKRMSVREVEHLLYEESGLLGVSGASRSMADLLARPDDPASREAIDFFCYQARKHLAALTAPLGGLDCLVFTGGIGANSPEIRARILDGLSYLGLDLDRGRNDRNEPMVSVDGSAVRVEAFRTDEELMIARHVRDVLAAGRPMAREA